MSPFICFLLLFSTTLTLGSAYKNIAIGRIGNSFHDKILLLESTQISPECRLDSIGTIESILPGTSGYFTIGCFGTGYSILANAQFTFSTVSQLDYHEEPLYLSLNVISRTNSTITTSPQLFAVLNLQSSSPTSHTVIDLDIKHPGDRSMPPRDDETSAVLVLKNLLPETLDLIKAHMIHVPESLEYQQMFRTIVDSRFEIAFKQSTTGTRTHDPIQGGFFLDYFFESEYGWWFKMLSTITNASTTLSISILDNGQVEMVYHMGN
ncbi:hypothetical protein P9112_010737 [Eukaryota sp. TZLM1-RC]